MPARLIGEGIKIKGRVDIGEELQLEEIEPPDDATDSDMYFVEDSVLPPHERVSLRVAPSRRNLRQDFTYTFNPLRERVCFEDMGLALQYGILGGPGSGKTNLLTYLLRQLVAHRADKRDPHNPARKYGGIILDPKAALIDDVRRVFKEAGRDEDLIVLNSRELKRTGGINLIDCVLAPKDLAKALVLAAQSAGIGGNEPFWFQQMAGAFGAILALLEFMHPERKPTLNEMITNAVGQEDSTEPGKRGSTLDALIAKARVELGKRAGAEAAIAQLNDARVRLDELARHKAADPKNRITVEQFMEQAFGLFRDSAYACYSTSTSDGARGRNMYDQIVDRGKVILVSPAPQDLSLAALLNTLVKLIFQRTVLSRFDRYVSWQLHNCERPLFLVADEYHTVATQVPGERIGDAEYFSMARQFGGLCIVATQTIKQLQTSALEETWEAVFGTLAAVIGMKVEDADTIEYLQERAGKKDVLQTTESFNSKSGEVTIEVKVERTEVSKIPAAALKMFRQGHAVVIGSTTGPLTPASVRFVQVPPAWPKEGDSRA